MQKYQDSIVNPDGTALQGVSVRVQTYPGAVDATIYSDNGVTTKTNPITTDSLGAFSFYAADGRYQLVISGPGITARTVTDILLEDVNSTLSSKAPLANPTFSGTSSFVGASGVGAIRVAGAGGSFFWIDNPTPTVMRLSSGASPGTGAVFLDNAGRLGIGLTPTSRNNTTLQIVDGIGFPAIQMASSDPNTMDDYEEGNFTPAFVAGPSTFSYSVQQGFYTKKGNEVTVSGRIELNTSGNTLNSSSLQLSGFPFLSKSTTNYISVASFWWAGLATPSIAVTGLLGSASSTLAMYLRTAATVGDATMNHTNLSATAGTYLYFSFSYLTD